MSDGAYVLLSLLLAAGCIAYLIACVLDGLGK